MTRLGPMALLCRLVALAALSGCPAPPPTATVRSQPAAEPIAEVEPAAAAPARRRGFEPNGALPQHRAWLAGSEVRALQRAGDALYWIDDEKVYTRTASGRVDVLHDARTYISQLAVSPSGAGAIVAGGALTVIGPPARTLPVAAPSTITWCRERLFVAGESLAEVVDGKLVEVARVAGEVSPRACGNGRLALIVAGGVKVLTVATGRWSRLLRARGTYNDRPYDVAVAPSGAWVAAVEQFGTLWLWDDEGRRAAWWPGVGGQAATLAFSPDSASLAVGAVRFSVPELALLGRFGPSVGGEVAWSADGARLATARGEVVSEIDVAGDERAPLPRGLTGTVRAMQVDPARERLFTSDDSGQILAWSLDTLEVVGGFDGGEWGMDKGSRLAVLPDGTLLTGAGAALVRFTPEGRRIESRTFASPEGEGLSLSADGARVAVTGSNHAYVFDWKSGEQLLASGPYKTAPGEFDGSAESVSMHPDGAVVAVGGRRVSHVLSLADGTSLGELAALPGYGNTVQFSPDGKHIFHSTSLGAQLYAWPGLAATALPEQAHWADHATFSGDGRELFLSEWSGQLVALDLGASPSVRWEAQAPWHIGAHAVDFAKQRVFTAGPDLPLIVWSAKDGKVLGRRPAGAGQRTTTLSFSPNGRYLASGNGAGELHVFDLENGEQRRYWHDETVGELDQVFVDDSGAVTAMDSYHSIHLGADSGARVTSLSGTYGSGGAISRAGGPILFADHDDDKLLVVEPASGNIARRPLPASFAGHSVRVSPDGHWWLEIEEIWEPQRLDRVRLIEVATGKIMAQLDVPEPSLTPLGWTDGAGFIVDGGTLQRWDPAAGTPARIAVARDMPAMAVSAEHVAGAYGEAVVVARLADGAIVHVLAGHQTRIDAMAFSADGKTLASGDFAGNLWLWDVGAGRARMRIVAGVGRWSCWRDDGRWREGARQPE
jgi:WD40 repeat protein